MQIEYAILLWIRHHPAANASSEYERTDEPNGLKAIRAGGARESLAKVQAAEVDGTMIATSKMNRFSKII